MYISVNIYSTTDLILATHGGEKTKCYIMSQDLWIFKYLVEVGVDTLVEVGVDTLDDVDTDDEVETELDVDTLEKTKQNKTKHRWHVKQRR